MRADLNLCQHLRDRHGLSEGEIGEVLKDFYAEEEEFSKESFKCPRCGGGNLHLKVKCTIAADVEGAEVKGWWISRVFYTTLACRECEAGELEDAGFFYDFEALPRSVKSGIFNLG
jgi:hypothetical protein